MGDDINFFVTRDLKRYTLSKDQSTFGPLRRLHAHILNTIGLETQEVTDHLEATDGIDPYHSSPPHPSQPILATTTTQGPSRSTPTSITTIPHSEPQSTQKKSTRLKQIVSSKKAPCFKHKKRGCSSMKRKSRTIESSDDSPFLPPTIMKMLWSTSKKMQIMMNLLSFSILKEGRPTQAKAKYMNGPIRCLSKDPGNPWSPRRLIRYNPFQLLKQRKCVC